MLNLKDPADREVLLRLCEQADAIVENMRVGVMDRLGVGYDVIKARNPKIVYGCIRGFGDPRTGESPYAEWPAYDIVAQSMSGHVAITGPEGSIGHPSGVSVGDIYPGTLMAMGVIAGIHHARATGEGQFCDVGMYDGMLAFAETVLVNYGYAQQELPARGQHHPNLMPFGLFPTKDGGVAIAAPGPGHWALLCEAMERPDLLADERTKKHLHQASKPSLRGRRDRRLDPAAHQAGSLRGARRQGALRASEHSGRHFCRPACEEPGDD